MATPGGLLAENYSAYISQNGGFNTALPITTSSSLVVGGTITAAGQSYEGAQTITAASANALTVGPNGTTNPTLNVNTNTASAATGLTVTGAAAAGGLAIQETSSGTNESMTIDAKSTGTIGLNTLATGSGLVTIGNTTSLAGATVNGPLTAGSIVTAGTAATGALTVTGKVTASGALSSFNASVTQHTPTAINSTAGATAAQVATGYITSTSGAATTITLPTSTLIAAAIGAVQGTVFDLYIDNTAGANTVTITPDASQVKSQVAQVATYGVPTFGLFTVASGTSGLACFRLVFSSATAASIARVF